MWRVSFMTIMSALYIASLISDAKAGQCTQAIESYQKELSKTDAGMGPTDPAASTTISADTASEPEADETPATAAMSEAVEGKATSAQDVQNQNQGEPTAADAAQAEGIAPAAGPNPQVTLDHARALDEAGKEAECMAVIELLKSR